jgi:hypothetical protein
VGWRHDGPCLVVIGSLPGGGRRVERGRGPGYSLQNSRVQGGPEEPKGGQRELEQNLGPSRCHHRRQRCYGSSTS